MRVVETRRKIFMGNLHVIKHIVCVNKERFIIYVAVVVGDVGLGFQKWEARGPAAMLARSASLGSILS